MCVYPNHQSLIGKGSPRWRLRKLALNSRTTRRSAKNVSVPPKKPFIAAITSLLKAPYLSLLHNKVSTASGDDRNLRHLNCWQDPNMSLHDHRTVQNRTGAACQPWRLLEEFPLLRCLPCRVVRVVQHFFAALENNNNNNNMVRTGLCDRLFCCTCRHDGRTQRAASRSCSGTQGRAATVMHHLFKVHTERRATGTDDSHQGP